MKKYHIHFLPVFISIMLFSCDKFNLGDEKNKNDFEKSKLLSVIDTLKDSILLLHCNETAMNKVINDYQTIIDTLIFIGHELEILNQEVDYLTSIKVPYINQTEASNTVYIPDTPNPDPNNELSIAQYSELIYARIDSSKVILERLQKDILNRDKKVSTLKMLIMWQMKMIEDQEVKITRLVQDTFRLSNEKRNLEQKLINEKEVYELERNKLFILEGSVEELLAKRIICSKGRRNKDKYYHLNLDLCGSNLTNNYIDIRQNNIILVRSPASKILIIPERPLSSFQIEEIREITFIKITDFEKFSQISKYLIIAKK